MINTRLWAVPWLAALLVLAVESSAAQNAVTQPLLALQELDASPHIVRIALTDQDLIDYEIGLGAMQKVRGAWRFKNSERHSGHLSSYTWQVIDGFSAEEVLATLEDKVRGSEQGSLLFECDGRACGHPTQWANRVFGQRLLYGRVDLQRYRIYAYEGEHPGRLILYTSSRSTDRQYFHAQWLDMPLEMDAEQAM